jgi:hypothetical protein
MKQATSWAELNDRLLSITSIVHAVLSPTRGMLVSNSQSFCSKSDCSIIARMAFLKPLISVLWYFHLHRMEEAFAALVKCGLNDLSSQYCGP